MTKVKISATVKPERLEQARQVTGTANVSQLLDLALSALIERELEQRWLDGYADDDRTDLPAGIPVDLSDVPWDDE